MWRVREGCSDAFASLVGRHWESVVRHASRTLILPDDAEDVAQECFIRIWKGRALWRPTGTFEGYLYRITQNLSLNENRRRRGARSRRNPHCLHSSAQQRPADPHEILLLRQLESEASIAIQALPARQREALLLSLVYGLSAGEIGYRMGISSQTAANQLCRARASLRASLCA